MSDFITLNIPAKADYLLTVRLAASSIGSRMGFDINEIEDIKTATAEACLIIMQAGKSSELKIEFDIDEDRIKINVLSIEGKVPNIAKTGEDSTLGQYLLEALSDDVVFNKKNNIINNVSFCKNLTVK